MLRVRSAGKGKAVRRRIWDMLALSLLALISLSKVEGSESNGAAGEADDLLADILAESALAVPL